MIPCDTQIQKNNLYQFVGFRHVLVPQCLSVTSVLETVQYKAMTVDVCSVLCVISGGIHFCR